MDPLKVYDIGQLGVQLVASPLHQQPASEVIRAQNAVYDKDASTGGGLRKRGGMTKVNAVAMNSGGAIKGAKFVAFPDPSNPFVSTGGLRRGLYLQPVSAAIDIPYSSDPNNWAGELTVDHNLLFMMDSNAFAAGGNRYFPASVSLPGRIYLLGVGATDGSGFIRSLSKWDGSNFAIVAQPAKPPQTGGGTAQQMTLTALYPLDSLVYLTSNDGDGTNTTFGRVFEFDPSSEDMQQIGTSTFGTHAGGLGPGMPAAMTWFQGSLFVATSSSDPTTTPKIYSIRPGVDEDWTLEDSTGTVGLTYTGLFVFQGDLYATTKSLVGGTASVIRKRANGVWSVSRTNGSTTIANGYGQMVSLVTTTMFVTEIDKEAVNNSVKVLSFDGTSYSTSRDFRVSDYAGTALKTLVFGYPVQHNGSLYYTTYLSGGVAAGTTDNVLSRWNGSTWSAVRTKLDTDTFITADLIGPLRD